MVASAATAPAAAARLVTTTMSAKCRFVAFSVEPGLKPNQPNPAEPQDQHTELGKGHVVARDGIRSALLVLADARPKQQESGQTGGCAREVHHRRTCEVLAAKRCHQEAATEELVADERIDEGGKRNAE